jgi:hypothetical protein
MTNGVVLTAALRSNLLSLQQTQKDIDTHQNRLATGKKVNSALDNPQAFFAAQSLTNRANDLSNLLDSIGQSIQVINAANNGVSALTTLINQAQSIANSAQSTLAGASTQAQVTGSVNLGTGKLTSIPGIAATSELDITVTDPAGGASPISLSIVTIAANDTAADLVTKINDLNTALSTQAISASLDSNGHLVLTAVNGGTLAVKFGDTTSGAAQAGFAATSAAQDTTLQSFAAALGFSGVALLNQNGAAAVNDSVDFTQTASSAITSKGLYTAVGVLAQGSTLLSAVKDSTGAGLTTLVAADTLNITVGGKTTVTDLLHINGATAITSTIQNVVDGINNDANIKSLISASFDATTGKISLTPLSSSATDVQIQFSSAAADKVNLGFGVNTFTLAAAGKATEEIRFGAAAGTLAGLQTQYNTTLSQITALVADTGYAGTNLLNGNDLTTYFNETRTSSLTTEGVTFTSAGLSLTAGNFQSSASITTAINQTIAALTTVRNFGSTLSNNLSIIQNRQDFTNNLINTLKTGSDALTNADQNEEGASLLALQTRQSLGITSLSLASQAQQAILKLF